MNKNINKKTMLIISLFLCQQTNADFNFPVKIDWQLWRAKLVMKYQACCVFANHVAEELIYKDSKLPLFMNDPRCLAVFVAHGKYLSTRQANRMSEKEYVSAFVTWQLKKLEAEEAFVCFFNEDAYKNQAKEELIKFKAKD
jgi:hypothetical protein